MTDTAVRGGVTPSLGARGAGHWAIQECIRAQAAAKPRGALATMLGVSPLHPGARQLYLAAIGQIAVAAQLAKLGDGWLVLNSVPVGAGEGDIDHVVIGPPGVFVIATRNHPGKKIHAAGNLLTVDGHKTEYIRNSRYEERRATDLLRQSLGAPVAVTPLIILAASSSISLGKKTPAVAVLSIDRIPRWLQNRDDVLSPRALERIFDVAMQRATWQTTSPVADDSLRDVPRFERLRREVESARARRRRVTFTGMGASAAAVGTILAVLLPGILSTVMAAVP